MATAATAAEETTNLSGLQAQLLTELDFPQQESVSLFQNAYMKYVMSLKPATLNDANYVLLFRKVVAHFKHRNSQTQHKAGASLVSDPATTDSTSNSVTSARDSINACVTSLLLTDWRQKFINVDREGLERELETELLLLLGTWLGMRRYFRP